MLNRRIVVAAFTVVLFCTTVISDAHAAPFQIGDFITYSQASWGDATAAGGAELAANYDSVYASTGGVVEIGIPGASGFSITFTGTGPVFDYLPSSGPPAPLNADLIDPTSSPSGIFGGEVLGLRFNIDFADAGHTLGTLGIPFGDLTFFALTGSLATFNGTSVRAFSNIANTALGGGSTGLTIADLNALAFALNVSFMEGTPSPFAQDHLRIAAQPVPEPATLSLLGIGVAALTVRRFKRKGRERG